MRAVPRSHAGRAFPQPAEIWRSRLVDFTAARRLVSRLAAKPTPFPPAKVSRAQRFREQTTAEPQNFRGSIIKIAINSL